ncbi:arabinogalactan protein 41-like [Punica granatum]|uniref:Uncharacterized protein n=2 Tax=Punica granatum TaxID=22663 RepID=A0A2I0KVN5_PUNGR|nr:arabinogalactan protein 41-like [Punica granatum]PKI72413.1 hypothetical protein CRG98_007159 [Punica granatum]
MAVAKMSFGVVAVVVLLCAMMVMLPIAGAQSPAPAPGPSSDGNTIDQGIAYGLMLVALLVTYLIH